MASKHHELDVLFYTSKEIVDMAKEHIEQQNENLSQIHQSGTINVIGYNEEGKYIGSTNKIGDFPLASYAGAIHIIDDKNKEIEALQEEVFRLRDLVKKWRQAYCEKDDDTKDLPHSK